MCYSSGILNIDFRFVKITYNPYKFKIFGFGPTMRWRISKMDESKMAISSLRWLLGGGSYAVWVFWDHFGIQDCEEILEVLEDTRGFFYDVLGYQKNTWDFKSDYWDSQEILGIQLGSGVPNEYFKHCMNSCKPDWIFRIS